MVQLPIGELPEHTTARIGSAVTVSSCIVTPSQAAVRAAPRYKCVSGLHCRNPLRNPHCLEESYFFSSIPAVGPPPFFITQQATSLLPQVLQVWTNEFTAALPWPLVTILVSQAAHR